MDPDANLQEQLELARKIQEIQDGSDDEGNLSQEELLDVDAFGARLAELVIALDEWIGKGGFLPERWKR